MFYCGWDTEKRQIFMYLKKRIKGEKYKNLYNFLTCLV